MLQIPFYGCSANVLGHAELQMALCHLPLPPRMIADASRKHFTRKWSITVNRKVPITAQSQTLPLNVVRCQFLAHAQIGRRIHVVRM